MSWLLVALGVWLLWAGAIFLLQRRMIYPRHLLNPAAGAARATEGVEEVALETASGPGLAFYLAPEGADSPAPAMIFAHGNAELARDWAGAYRSLARGGVAVLLVEYPGYGAAPGAPTIGSIGDAMVAGYDWLAARPEVDGERIVGLGRSLGGGAVGVLAGERPLAGLVLQSTFARASDFARRMLLPGALVRDPFDNLAVVEAFEGPILLFHGRRDRVIPYRHGVRLAEAAGGRGEMVTWECAHNDCPDDWGQYVARVIRFAHDVPPRPDSR